MVVTVDSDGAHPAAPVALGTTRDASVGDVASVFISYSRHDQDFVRSLHDELTNRGFKVWVDWNDIPYGADFPSEILDNIERNDTFLFVISPDAVASEWCSKELTHAAENRKRIMPVLHREVDPAQTPAALGHLNWLFMQAGDPLAQAFDKLAAAITTDLQWVKVHSWLLQRAGRWDRAGCNPNLLMRGSELQEANAWLTQATVNRGKSPAPVQVQADYVTSSRHGQRVRQRQRLALVALIAVLGLVSAGVSAVAAAAEHDKQQAVRRAAILDTQRRQVLLAHSFDQSRTLAADAAAQQTADPELGMLLAAQAMQRYPTTVEAQNALAQALGASRVRLVLHGHSDQVPTAVFSPDGLHVLTASYDSSARIWDAVSGRETALLAGHTTSLLAAAFNARGTRAVTAGFDGARTGQRTLRRTSVNERREHAQVVVFDRPCVARVRAPGRVPAGGGRTQRARLRAPRGVRAAPDTECPRLAG